MIAPTPMQGPPSGGPQGAPMGQPPSGAGGPPQGAGGPPQPPQGVNPQQIQQMLAEQQQAIIAKYAPQLRTVQDQVTIDAVVALLRDDRTRSFTFEIESSSTILTDETEEKASHNEFLEVFSGASEKLMQMASLGDAGADLAGELMKFAVAPYRAGRQLEGAIQAFIDAAPEMAAKAAQQASGGQQNQQALVQAQQQMAQAEQVKAQAAMLKVQADAQLAAAQNQQKMADLQGKLQIEGDKHNREVQALQAKSEGEMGKLQLQVNSAQADGVKMLAEIDLIRAQTAQILASIGLDVRSQDLDEYTAASAAQDAEFERLHAGAGGGAKPVTPSPAAKQAAADNPPQQGA
jgi:hypothetical protein